MSIGNQQAYPQERINGDGYREPVEGMTYRQWLIGQIANGLSSDMNISGDNAVNYSIDTADAIIAALDKEAAQ